MTSWHLLYTYILFFRRAIVYHSCDMLRQSESTSTSVGKTPSQIVLVMKTRFALTYLVEAQRVLECRRALHRLHAFVLNLRRSHQTSLTILIQDHPGRAFALHIVCADHILNMRAFLIFPAMLPVSCEYNYVIRKIQRKSSSRLGRESM